MANIDDYLVASYRCNGKGNSDADRDVLKDLSGNGHDIVLKNFGFTLGSGYEGGALVFDGIDDYGICEDFPALKDFTIIYKRINLNPSKTNQAFISNRSKEITKRLIIEHTYSNANVTIVGSSSKSIASVYDPSKKPVYVLPTSYNGQISLGKPTFDPVIGLILGNYPSESSVYCWNGAFYALDIYDRTLSDEYLQKALNRMNDIDINWKDGVGEVTGQPLTISPGSGTGNAAVSFGSVMNKGLDRTLELEITTPKGVKKTLTVNQEGCRQAYITSDGKRWLTSDNRVYGILKSDAPCERKENGCIQEIIEAKDFSDNETLYSFVNKDRKLVSVYFNMDNDFMMSIFMNNTKTSSGITAMANDQDRSTNFIMGFDKQGMFSLNFKLSDKSIILDNNGFNVDIISTEPKDLSNPHVRMFDIIKSLIKDGCDIGAGGEVDSTQSNMNIVFQFE